MRISGVTGDLPAVAALPEPPAPPPAADTAPAPAVTAPAAPGAGSDAAGGDPSRSRRMLVPVFDPPLIAQRAVLGLPVGPLIADHALAEGISYGAACAAVDREMPEPEPTPEP